MIRGRVDANGLLRIIRPRPTGKNDEIHQYCPTADDRPHCGDWCPQFMDQDDTVRLRCMHSEYPLDVITIVHDERKPNAKL